jgi:hypothetical protein
MTTLFKQESFDPKNNAQRNLCGRTHYVDDDTLRFYKSRVISARHTEGGLLFAIVTSDAKDYQNRSRGFRYVIFDVFGNVVEDNPDRIERGWFRTSDKAAKAMWDALNKLDAPAITRKAIENARRYHADAMARLEGEIVKISADKAA